MLCGGGGKQAPGFHHRHYRRSCLRSCRFWHCSCHHVQTRKDRGTHLPALGKTSRDWELHGHRIKTTPRSGHTRRNFQISSVEGVIRAWPGALVALRIFCLPHHRETYFAKPCEDLLQSNISLFIIIYLDFWIIGLLLRLNPHNRTILINPRARKN